MEIYKTCKKLPLERFCLIIEENDLKYLFVDEESMVTEEVQNTWFDILDEISKLDPNFLSGVKSETISQIRFLESQMIKFKGMIFYLSNWKNEDYIKELKNFGYKIDDKEYFESLEKADKKVSSLQNRINSLIKSLEDEEQGKVETFDDKMAWIAENGFKVDDNITVSRFISIKKRIEQKKKKREHTA